MLMTSFDANIDFDFTYATQIYVIPKCSMYLWKIYLQKFIVKKG